MTDPYTEHRRREARRLLAVANSARRSGAIYSAAGARRQVARLFTPSISRLELESLERAEEEDRLEVAWQEHAAWLAEEGESHA